MSYVVIRKDGSLVGTTSDLVSEASHFESRQEACACSLRWVGAVVAKVRSADMFKAEPLRESRDFRDHIAGDTACDDLELDW